MKPNTVYLAVAPNILRKTAQDLGRLFPDLEMLPPQTHGEMQEFCENFGREDIPALSIAAYPQFVRNILEFENDGLFEPMPAHLAPMRRELTALGLSEPSVHMRVVTLVPFVIAARMDLAPSITDWRDLCREDICRHVAVPPEDTPLPDLFDAVMGQTYGPEATEVMRHKDTRFTPLDINKHVDDGTFKAGVSIPAFSKTFRNNGGHMVWPKSGAWVVPLVACIRKNAAPDVFNFLDYLLSEAYQCYLSQNGYTIPVINNVPWFPEMEEAGATLLWPGWEALTSLGQNTDCAS
jgi:hypothetical protein